MLNLDWNIIWAIANILILYILLRIFLFKPINKIMDERTNAIQSDIDNARQSKEEAEELKEQYTESLADAKSKAKQIMTKAYEEAAIEKRKILNQSQEEANQIIANANINIENERKRTMLEAEGQIADLAMAAAAKLIDKNISDDVNKKLIDDFLAEEGID